MDIFPNKNTLCPLTVGIEIETTCDIDQVSRILHFLRNYWNTSSDGSIHPDYSYQGIEFKSYILRSQYSVMKALSLMRKAHEKYDIRPNDTCGVHIHLGIKSFLDRLPIPYRYTVTKNMILLFAVLEPILFATTTRKRIDSIYCKPILSCWKLSDIMFTAKQSFSNKIGDTDGTSVFETRYRSLNMSAIRKYGTAEVRIFESTNNMEFVFNWVVLTSAILCRGMSMKPGQTLSVSNLPLNTILVDILRLPDRICDSILHQIEFFSRGEPVNESNELTTLVSKAAPAKINRVPLPPPYKCRTKTAYPETTTLLRRLKRQRRRRSLSASSIKGLDYIAEINSLSEMHDLQLHHVLQSYKYIYPASWRELQTQIISDLAIQNLASYLALCVSQNSPNIIRPTLSNSE